MRNYRLIIAPFIGLLAVIGALWVLGSAPAVAAPSVRPLANHGLTGTLYAVDVVAELCSSVGFPFSPKAWMPHDMNNALGMEDGALGYFEKITDTYGTLCADPGTIGVILDFGASYSVTDVSFWSSGDMSDIAAGSLWCNTGDCADPDSDDWHSFPGGDSSDWYTPTESVQRLDMETDYGAGVEFRYLLLKIEGATGDPDLVRANLDAVRISYISTEQCPPLVDAGFQNDYSSPSGTEAWISPQYGGGFSELDVMTGHLYLPSRSISTSNVAAQNLTRTGILSWGYHVQIVIYPTDEFQTRQMWLGFVTNTAILRELNGGQNPTELGIFDVATITIPTTGMATTSIFTTLVTAPLTESVWFFMAPAEDYAEPLQVEFVCVEPSSEITSTGGGGGGGGGGELPPDPDQQAECSGGLIPNGNFDAAEGWELAGGATISGSQLYLGFPGDAATTTFFDMDFVSYQLVIAAAPVDGYVATLAIGVQGEPDFAFLTWDGPATYTLSLPKPLTGTYQQLTLAYDENELYINWVCLHGSAQTDPTTGRTDCLSVIVNGSFDTGSGWSYLDGAAYNSVEKSAWLPAQVGIQARVMQAVTLATPDISTTQHINIEFEVRSTVPTQTAYISVLGLTRTIIVGDFNAGYEINGDSLAGTNGNGIILAKNITEDPTGTAPGFFLDNICLYVSTEPADEDGPTPPDGPGPGGPGDPEDPGNSTAGGLTCANFNSWILAATGLNLTELENMPMPELWEFSDWVPWLAGRLWMNIAKPIICAILIIAQVITNWLWWTIAQPGHVIRWLVQWVNDNAGIMSRWVGWAMYYVIWFGNGGFFNWVWANLSAFITDVLPWLWEVLSNGLSWAVASAYDTAVTIWNLIVEVVVYLWPIIMQIMQFLIDIGVFFWNWVIWPIFGRLFFGFFYWIIDFFWWFWEIGGWLWDWFLSYLGVNPDDAINLTDVIWLMFSALWMLIMVLWNFVTNIFTMPFTFYQHWEGVAGAGAYTILEPCMDNFDANRWCRLYAGIEVVNMAIAHSIGYPIVIVGIIITTITVISRHIWALLDFQFK